MDVPGFQLKSAETFDGEHEDLGLGNAGPGEVLQTDHLQK
jgi:hypothetical protein